MKAYQEKMPIMTYILKEKNPNNPPKYFTDFKEKVESFIDEQKQFNKQVLEFMVEQRKFNQLIMKRLDNIVKKNNLKE